MKKHQKGFAIIELSIIIAIAVVIMGLGWYVLHNQRNNTKDNNRTTTSQSPKTQVKASGATTEQESVLSQSANGQQSSPAPSQSSTAPATQTPSTVSSSNAPKVGNVYEVYRISSDGSTAQETPVTTTLSNVSSVNITVDLQCSGPCNFKLVSDSYSLTNTATYTSSQKITYTIPKPDSYILYNQFTPNTKFKVVF